MFENIEKLRSLLKHFKEDPLSINEYEKSKLKEICIELESSHSLINSKDSLQLIQKRLNKRKKIKKTSKTLYYHNELANLLKNKGILNETGSKEPEKILPDEAKVRNENNIFYSLQDPMIDYKFY